MYAHCRVNPNRICCIGVCQIIPIQHNGHVVNLVFLHRGGQQLPHGIVLLVRREHNDLPDGSLDCSLCIRQIVTAAQLRQRQAVGVQGKLVLRLPRVLADHNILLEARIGQRILNGSLGVICICHLLPIDLPGVPVQRVLSAGHRHLRRQTDAHTLTLQPDAVSHVRREAGHRRICLGAVRIAGILGLGNFQRNVLHLAVCVQILHRVVIQVHGLAAVPVQIDVLVESFLVMQPGNVLLSPGFLLLENVNFFR